MRGDQEERKVLQGSREHQALQDEQVTRVLLEMLGKWELLEDQGCL